MKRQYLWQLVGLIDSADEVDDLRLRAVCARVERLPDGPRNLIIGIVSAALAHFEEQPRA